MDCAEEDLASVMLAHDLQLARQIGEGAFAKAFLVKTAAGAKAVCKVVDVTQASEKEAEDAAKEGRLLASMRHPFIVRYRDSFCAAGRLCIVMDFCEGGELAQRIQQARRSRARFPEEQLLRWFTQAMLALKYIHDKHILHRDLKPANFFLTKNGALKMGDFGIAKTMDCTMACAKTRIGTPYYLSPEVCQEKPYTWPADIWAMGCVLYEMSALQVPFDANSISALVQKICHGPAVVVPRCYSAFLQGLCEKMLDRDPNRRPSADEVLKHPEIQIVVRCMLEEIRIQPPAASGIHKKGDAVEFRSAAHRGWLPAFVIDTDPEGSILIDLKPNSWLPTDQQATKIRLQVGSGSDCGGKNRSLQEQPTGLSQQQGPEARPASISPAESQESRAGSHRRCLAAEVVPSTEVQLPPVSKLPGTEVQLPLVCKLPGQPLPRPAAAEPCEDSSLTLSEQPQGNGQRPSSRVAEPCEDRSLTLLLQPQGNGKRSSSRVRSGSGRNYPCTDAGSALPSKLSVLNDQLDQLMVQAFVVPLGLHRRTPSLVALDRRPSLSGEGAEGQVGANGSSAALRRNPSLLVPSRPFSYRPPSAEKQLQLNIAGRPSAIDGRAATPPTRPGTAEQGSDSFKVPDQGARQKASAACAPTSSPPRRRSYAALAACRDLVVGRVRPGQLTGPGGAKEHKSPPPHNRDHPKVAVAARRSALHLP